MAVLSSHFLNAVDGSHAGAVSVTLAAISDKGDRKILFAIESDETGRFSKAFDADTGQVFEMVIASGDYFRTAGHNKTWGDNRG